MVRDQNLGELFATWKQNKKGANLLFCFKKFGGTFFRRSPFQRSQRMRGVSSFVIRHLDRWSWQLQLWNAPCRFRSQRSGYIRSRTSYYGERGDRCLPAFLSFILHLPGALCLVAVLVVACYSSPPAGAINEREPHQQLSLLLPVCFYPFRVASTLIMPRNSTKMYRSKSAWTRCNIPFPSW